MYPLQVLQTVDFALKSRKYRTFPEIAAKVTFSLTLQGFCRKVEFWRVLPGFWPSQDLPGISPKNSIVFVFFYCSSAAKKRPKNTPKWTLPHQMIHFWFSGFPGKSKCRVKNDVFVGIRTAKSENRSPVWPVIWKVFCRIKWSIISGPLDLGRTPGSGK